MAEEINKLLNDIEEIQELNKIEDEK